MAVFRAAATAWQSSASSATCDRPVGVASGDLLVAFIQTTANRTIGTLPSGWVGVSNTLGGAITESSTGFLVQKRAGGSEPSSYTFGVSGGSTGIRTVIVAFEQAEDVDGGQLSVGNAASATLALSSVTAAEDSLLVGIWGLAASGASISSPPSGMSQRFAVTSDRSAAVYDQTISAGSTGSRSLTWSTTGAHRGFLFALAHSNTAPDAPILTSPVDGQVVDLTGQIDLQGTFSDPDSGDELSAYEVEVRNAGGSGLIQPGQQPASGQTFSHPIAANSLSAGGWEWRARTWDAQGAMGEWSAWEQFQAASPPAAPVITTPADAGTIDSDPFTVTWTAPNQTHYQVRVLGDDAGSPDESDVLYDSGTVASTSARSLSVPFEANNLDVHVQVRVRYGGLWSPWASNAATVSYTPPATPTAVVALHETGAAIEVSATHPTPTGSEPDVLTMDIRRQQSVDDGATWTDHTGTAAAHDTIARGLAPDATHTDWLVAARTLYRYRVVAHGDNTTTAASAWEDGT